jgi:UDPglucose 6-dehydrogenase
MSKISIIGSGVVGSSVGAGFKKMGHNVLFYDIVKKPDTTTDITKILETEISFICVPTPYTDHPDMSYVLAAVKSVLNILNGKPHLLVIKSTVVPTTTDRLIVPLLPENVGVCVNPDFMTESSTARDRKSVV